MELGFDQTFFALVGLVLFFCLLIYLKVPYMVAQSLDKRADQISNELAEARQLREDAQRLLMEYQHKHQEAVSEAARIIASAEREAEMLASEAEKRTQEFIINRTALIEQKIKQAELNAIMELRATVIDLSIKAAETVIINKIDLRIQSGLFCNTVSAIKAYLN